jgi:hypothetical protein
VPEAASVGMIDQTIVLLCGSRNSGSLRQGKIITECWRLEEEQEAGLNNL